MNPILSAVLSMLFASIWCAWAADGRISGRITDTQDRPVAGANLRLSLAGGGATNEVTSDADGRFAFASVAQGDYQITATAQGFIDAKKAVHVGEGETPAVDLRFSGLAGRTDTVTVSAKSLKKHERRSSRKVQLDTNAQIDLAEGFTTVLDMDS